MKKNHDLGLLVLRVSLGVLMLLHGIAKIRNGTGFVEESFSKIGMPTFMAYSVYLTEILAPLMLIFGFRSRIAAILLAGTMFVVMFFVFPQKISQILPTGGWALELQALFLTGAVAVFLMGGGKYAVSTKSKWD